MSYKNQYSKYKSKYLELKNQVGGRFKYDDLKLPITTMNSFFEAILKFLNNYKFPELTYYELLENAGVKSTILNTDNADEQLLLYAQQITNFYNINIVYYNSKRELKTIRSTPQSQFYVELTYNFRDTYSLKHIKDEMDTLNKIKQSIK